MDGCRSCGRWWEKKQRRRKWCVKNKRKQHQSQKWTARFESGPRGLSCTELANYSLLVPGTAPEVAVHARGGNSKRTLVAMQKRKEKKEMFFWRGARLHRPPLLAPDVITILGVLVGAANTECTAAVSFSLSCESGLMRLASCSKERVLQDS